MITLEKKGLGQELDSLPWELKPVQVKRKSEALPLDFMALHYKGLCYLPTPYLEKVEAGPIRWCVIRAVSDRQIAVNSHRPLLFRFGREDNAALFILKISGLTDWTVLDNPEIGSMGLRAKLIEIYSFVKKLETITVA